MREYVGRYADYRAFSAEASLEEGPASRKRREPQATRARKGLSYAERKELDGLLDEIADLEAEKTALEHLFSSSRPSSEEMERSNRRYAELIALVEERTARWEFLAAKE
jgi:ATP-binding cassette subfamily F protein uup